MDTANLNVIAPPGQSLHALFAYFDCSNLGADGFVAQAAKQAGEQEVREPIVFDRTDPKWRELLDIDAKMFERRNIRLLTPEGRVFLALLVGGPLQVNSAMQVAGTSYRGFYAVLERLKQAGIVNINKDSEDQRVRKLTVDENEVPPGDSPGGRASS